MIWSSDYINDKVDENVRKNFLSHLYSALNQVGFRAYKDDKELQRGCDISIELLEAIEQSRIALIVFSKNYAGSRWCLDELVKILDCRERLGQIVLPIFFHVDPSDIHKQRGSFGEAFVCHQKVPLEKVERWKTALTNTASLAGFDLQNFNGDESELIKRIIEEMWGKLHPAYLSDVDKLFGIASREEELISLLRLDFKDVRFIGIYGMLGIGKTTIAKVIRNRIFPLFEGNSLLEDVCLASKQGDGLVDLQKRLLHDILRVRDLYVSNIDDGINKIKRRLQYKRVLVILDNVDHLDQLAALAKEHNWFGAGSRIIVTSRDENLLNAHRVDAKFLVLPLSFYSASQLFCWHAFRQHDPPDYFAELSHKIVRYAGGHPLALKVLGSFLSDKTIPEWISAFEELKSAPNGEIYEGLKMGLDSLNDHQRAIFLDIAFFFVGMDEKDAIPILDGCGFHTKILLRVLTQKCLLTVSLDNKLIMHDLLQNIAREIVRRENADEPGKRSRLSFHKDVRKVLKHHEGTDKVAGLVGNFPRLGKKSFSTEALARMNKLRILHLRNAGFIGGCQHFSKELRWLCWERFPWESIPPGLNLKRLVVLKLRYSHLKQIWEQTEVLKNLKVLDLSHSHNLIRISDISGLSNIENLIFMDCINLIEVHQSIGNLGKLISLDLENCKNLVHLPTQICKLSFLENLNLYHCSKLTELPEDFGNMDSLKELNIGLTAINSLPISIGRLKNLTEFLWDNEGNSFGSPDINSLSALWNFASLISLNLSLCNLSNNSFPRDLNGLPALEKLLLRGNSFHSLPPCLLHLPKLKELDVSDCDLSRTTDPIVCLSTTLQKLDLSKNNFCSLPIDLSSLPHQSQVNISKCNKLQTVEANLHTHLNARNCTVLERVAYEGVIDLQENHIQSVRRFNCSFFAFNGCEKLVEIQGIYKLRPLARGELSKLERLFGLDYLLKKQFSLHNVAACTWMKAPIQGLSQCGSGVYSIFLPGKRVPSWFNNRNKGNRLNINVPQLSCGSFEGLAVCVVYLVNKPYSCDPTLGIRIDNITTGCFHAYFPRVIGYPQKDEVMWVSYWRAPSLVNGGNRLLVEVRTAIQPFKVKEIGVRFLCEEMIVQLSGEHLLIPRYHFRKTTLDVFYFARIVEALDWESLPLDIKQSMNSLEHLPVAVLKLLMVWLRENFLIARAKEAHADFSDLIPEWAYFLLVGAYRRLTSKRNEMWRRKNR
ncbi:hypothetical protein SLEP1_g10132 [Rubroshorea leprosula]|uniref:ADP-ribosyl cyclase/cyclic ADP-ribose hydrolase n=1 Tax=Rubroshorea leprosula TaxID=152421 RepID=A0AAV5IH23_9ROSI|nr:hypothetical protein SLEP1_g10132 [Rubroshorea leprosula]